METQTAPTFAVQRAADRAFFDHGWLKTYHSFSFADYHDPKNLHWGALRVVNDDVVAPGQGFGAHPHRDMEIVTYVLRGELEHRDSMGNHGVVGRGEIQYLSAGTGIVHSEFNHSPEREVRLLQMWVLPRARGVTPSYGQESFTQTQRTNRWLVVAGGEAGVPAPVELRQDATLRVARLDAAAVAHEFAADRYGFLIVAEGSVVANGETLTEGDAVRMYGVPRLEVAGSGELVLWDLPPVDAA